jgi:hypothetical protein
MTRCFLCKKHITTASLILAVIEKCPELVGKSGRKMTVQICAECKNKSIVIKYRLPVPWINNLYFKSAYHQTDVNKSTLEGNK